MQIFPDQDQRLASGAGLHIIAEGLQNAPLQCLARKKFDPLLHCFADRNLEKAREIRIDFDKLFIELPGEATSQGLLDF